LFPRQLGLFPRTQDNLKRIEALNKLDQSAHYDVNRFADLTTEEFANAYLTKHVPSISHMPVAAHMPVNDLPTEFDWTTKGAVTPVKNQGQWYGSVSEFA
jgi:C1A family cysteine protease